MGKAFEKQIKTIEDQGEKQIDAVKDFKPKKAIKYKSDDDDYEDKLLHSNEREFFFDIFKKRLNKIEEITKKNVDNNLILTTLTTGEKFDLTGKNDPLAFL